MTTVTAPPITTLRPETVEKLSDPDLERELTLAAMRTHRHARYELLLAERRRRRRAAA